VNDKQSSRSHRQLHAINFLYDTMSDSDSITAVDTINDVVPAPDLTRDIKNAQRVCPDFKDVVNYLTTGSLPDNDVAARKADV